MSAIRKPVKPVDGSAQKDRSLFGHEHHIWDVDKVKALVADQSEAVTFFCGGSRNFPRFIDLFDGSSRSTSISTR